MKFISWTSRSDEECDYSPVLDVCTSSKRVAYDHYIIFRLVERSPRLVGDGNLLNGASKLEAEGRDYMDGLLGNKIAELWR